MPSSHASGSASADVRLKQKAKGSAAQRLIFFLIDIVSHPRWFSCGFLGFWFLGKHAIQSSGLWHGQRSRFTGLRGEPDRGVGGAEPVIVTPLHDLEEEPLVEDVGIDLEEF